jgi:hypothetical protein
MTIDRKLCEQHLKELAFSNNYWNYIAVRHEDEAVMLTMAALFSDNSIDRNIAQNALESCFRESESVGSKAMMASGLVRHFATGLEERYGMRVPVMDVYLQETTLQTEQSRWKDFKPQLNEKIESMGARNSYWQRLPEYETDRAVMHISNILNAANSETVNREVGFLAGCFPEYLARDTRLSWASDMVRHFAEELLHGGIRAPVIDIYRAERAAEPDPNAKFKAQQHEEGAMNRAATGADKGNLQLG